jgi:DNA polymerase-3 subunit beta
MRVQVEKSSIQKAVQSVQSVISSKSTLPILSNILVEASKNSLKFVATDLDVGISCNINANVLEEGATTIPAKKFSDIIKELPENTVLLTAKKNNNVLIECEKCYFKVMGLPKEEFPKLPDFQNKEMLSIKQEDLKNMLNITEFAISHDETRYVLNGILFVIKPNSLALVATDGRRLALVEKQMNIQSGFERRMIVPTKTIRELSRTLKDTGEVKIVFSENQVLFEVEDAMIISRLIEGEFPNYEQVIPKENKDKVTIDKQSLLSAAKRASLLTNQDSQAIKIDLLKDKMIISKNTPDVGEVKEELTAEYKGPDITIGFNPTYLIDVLRSLNRDKISLELVSPEKPGVLRTEEKYVYVVLPMQLT